MNTKQLIDEAVSLPVEERALVADTLLRSLNQTESEIDQKWITVGRKRLNELQAGSVNAIPGDKVIQNILSKFDK